MINFQPTDPYVQAAMNAAVNQNQQLENRDKSQQAENNLLIFKLAGGMFSLITKCEMEKELLAKSNEILKLELAQLERQHAAELDTSLMIKAIAEMVNAKIQDIEMTFQKCKNQYPEHYHSDKVSKFAILRDKVTQLAVIETEDTPKIEEDQEAPIIVQQDIFPISNSLVLVNIDPLLKNEIEVLAKKYEILEKDTSPLRSENQRLMSQKERIVEIHKENLKNRDLNTPIKKILDEVKATKENIKWEQLIKINQSRYGLGDFSPASVNGYWAPYIKFFSEYINSGKSQMESLILTLEAQLKEGTKS